MIRYAVAAALFYLVLGYYLVLGGRDGRIPRQVREFRLAEDALRATLRDPASAEFKDMKYCAEDRPGTISGEVNAKNGFGGFAGFEGFFVNGSIVEMRSAFGPLSEQCDREHDAAGVRSHAHLNPATRAKAEADDDTYENAIVVGERYK